MIPALKFFAAWLAAIASINSVVSWSAEMPGDCKFWSALALLALGGFLWLRRVEARRRAAERERMRAYREGWFASFERRRRMKEARR